MTESAYRKMRAINRQRRDNYIDARAISAARVYHRRRFIDAPSDGRYDLIDDVHQVSIVLEHDVAFFKNARALNVDLLGPVDKNVIDRWILEKWLERTEAENFIHHLEGESFTLATAQRCFEIC